MKNRLKKLLFFTAISLTLIGCGGVTLEEVDPQEDRVENPPSQDNEDSSSSQPVQSTLSPIEGSLSIIGKITYDRVAVHTTQTGLDYSNITQEPAKQLIIKAINRSGTAIATTSTDDQGNYRFDNLPQDTEAKIRVYAQMQKSGAQGWDVKIVDNANGSAQYVMEGGFASTNNSTERNMNAPSGWSGTSYRSSRTAAPFAILGSIYKAMQKVISVDPQASFPQLFVNWSVHNVSGGGATAAQLSDGQIGTSHFDGNNNLYILGDQNADTDEYDEHIVIHEWGHYFEEQFSRADSLGGPHGGGDSLDIRVAFGEGWGNSWAAMVTDNPIYNDTAGRSQSSSGVVMNIEDQTPNTPGWFSEGSVQRILYDIYDSNNDSGDTLSMGFKPIYDVLVGSQKTTKAFTSIFSFTKGLKTANSASVSQIDSILASESIGSITDIYGSSQSNLYINLPNDFQGGSAVTVCTSNEHGEYNKLNNHKFIKFTTTQTGSYKIHANHSDGRASDPYFKLFKMSPFEDLGPNLNEDGYGTSEEHDYSLTAGEYIIDIGDYNNLSRACFNITITK